MQSSYLLLVLLAVVGAASLTGAQRHRYRALHATLGSPAPAPPSSGPTPLSSACYHLLLLLLLGDGRRANVPVHGTSTAYAQGREARHHSNTVFSKLH